MNTGNSLKQQSVVVVILDDDDDDDEDDIGSTSRQSNRSVVPPPLTVPPLTPPRADGESLLSPADTVVKQNVSSSAASTITAPWNRIVLDGNSGISEEGPWYIQYRKQLLIAAIALFVLCIVPIIIVVILYVTKKTTTVTTPAEVPEPIIFINATAAPISPPTITPIVSPTSFPVSLPTSSLPTLAPQLPPGKCFDDSSELQKGVYKYMMGDKEVRSIYGDPIGTWCVSRITDFSYLFSPYAISAYYNISDSYADTVETMYNNNLISNYPNVTIDGVNLTALAGLDGATVSPTFDDFNEDISQWNMSSAIDVSYMFADTILFNQDISIWDMSNVIYMNDMFASTRAFNQNLSAWNTVNVQNMSNMFFGTFAFNNDISGWDVSNVQDMSSMFSNAVSFNQDLSMWNIQNVIYMNGMFDTAIFFNQDVSNWNIANVMDMTNLFTGAESFSQNLCTWSTKMNPMLQSVFQMFQYTFCPVTTDPITPLNRMNINMTTTPNATQSFCYPCS